MTFLQDEGCDIFQVKCVTSLQGKECDILPGGRV